MEKTTNMGLREKVKRAILIKRLLKKDKSNPTEVYRQVNDDIILHKGIPPYLKEGNPND